MKLKLLSALREALYALRVSLLAFAVALGISGMVSGPAMALLVDQTRIFNPRQLTEQAVNYYRITVNFNDQNIGAAQQFGQLPSNAYILAIDAYVNTAFNAGTTNAVTIGTTKANSNEIVATGINGTTSIAVGVLHLTSAAGLGTAVSMGGTWLNLPMPLFVKYAQTGTAATTGQVVIVITYMPNNDL